MNVINLNIADRNYEWCITVCPECGEINEIFDKHNSCVCRNCGEKYSEENSIF